VELEYSNSDMAMSLGAEFSAFFGGDLHEHLAQVGVDYHDGGVIAGFGCARKIGNQASGSTMLTPKAKLPPQSSTWTRPLSFMKIGP